ncbi:hypothetical protein EGW08_008935 [Elysia chlorotica]|uniref:DNA-repair protein Xrcc1 N-terminal domain-containing protein n=1 Tax=Elysia chlorotica TaxID=188477 RepID=A0A433TP00_ELYCH|nr:hypothetical protein EGW08_008935 [Elysia chlorotica]
MRDVCHKASNIVCGDGSRKWLSDSSDRSGKIEAVLQLEESCQLAYIDIGTIWCSSLEVRVGRSDWPQTTEYQSLIPVVNLMTPVDCRLGRASSVTKMFSKADFSSTTAAQSWDRVQVICRQPFRKDVQLGVSFIRLKSAKPTPQTDSNAETASKYLQETSNKTSRDVSSIQQHFFKKMLPIKSERASPAAQLKQKLLKISGSGEHGSEHEQSLSRTAKLVLKASENSDAQRLASPAPPTPKRGLFSDHLTKQKAVPIEKELKLFFPSLKISLDDVEKLTVADLRHKFEKKKRRKLTVEEKRKFSRFCEKFICSLLESEDGGDDLFASAVSNQTTPLRDDDNNISRSSDGIGKNENFTPKKYHNSSSVSPKLTIITAKSSSGTSQREKSSEAVPSVSVLEKASSQSNGKGEIFATVKLPHSLPTVSEAPLTSVNTNAFSCKVIPTRKSINVLDSDLNFEEKREDEDPESKNIFLREGSLGTNKDESEECSSVTYDEDEDEEGGDSDTSSGGSSPNILKSEKRKQTSNLENVRKSYEKLYNLDKSPKPCAAQTDASPQRFSQARKRKLDQEGSHIWHKLGSQAIGNNDEEKNEIKGGDEQSAAWQDQTAGSLAASSSSSATILALDSLPSQTILSSKVGQKNASPKTPKGKVYRMLTSSNGKGPKGLVEQKEMKGQSHVAQNITMEDRQTAKLGLLNEKGIGAVGFGSPKNGLPKSSIHAESVNESAVFPQRDDGDIPPKGRGRGHHSGQGRGRPARRRGASNATHSPTVSSPKPNNSRPELVFCDKCYGEFPSDVFGGHYTFCARPAVFADDDVSGTPGMSGTARHEALIDETVDYSECPICLERFPQDVLPVHASECGL